MAEEFAFGMLVSHDETEGVRDGQMGAAEREEGKRQQEIRMRA